MLLALASSSVFDGRGLTAWRPAGCRRSLCGASSHGLHIRQHVVKAWQWQVDNSSPRSMTAGGRARCFPSLEQFCSTRSGIHLCRRCQVPDGVLLMRLN